MLDSSLLNASDEQILAVWGKTSGEGSSKEYYPLLAHMLDTVAAIETLWEYWLRDDLKEVLSMGGDKDSTLAALRHAGGIHDIGKANPIFQSMATSGEKLKAEHSTQVSKLLQLGLPIEEYSQDQVAELRKFKLHRHEKIGSFLLSPDSPEHVNVETDWLALTTVGHHGSFDLSYSKGLRGSKTAQFELIKTILTDQWLAVGSRLKSSISQASGYSQGQKFTREGAILASGLVVLADRLASNESTVAFSLEQQHQSKISILEPLAYVAHMRSKLEMVLRKELGVPKPLSTTAILGDFERRGLQLHVPETGGIWLAMAPTGVGKTEAALLRHAKINENLTLLLPTQATTNAMFQRMKKVFGSEQRVATLAHGGASIDDFYQRQQHVDDDCGLRPTTFTRYGATLGGELTVATIDQLLASALPQKWAHVRLLTVANSHLVIDELHLVDHYQVELLKELLQFLRLCRTRITLLSATLPNWIVKELFESYSDKEPVGELSFPSTFTLSPELVRKELQLPFDEPYIVSYDLIEVDDVEKAHIEWAENTLKAHPKARLGVFVNTVRRAQAVAEELRGRLPDTVEVICFHSRMLPAHKEQIVKHLVKAYGSQSGNGESLVLVGTQVIEMSLDIDLDLISTDICPAPNLVQRLGRQWRNKYSEERFKRIPSKLYPEMRAQFIATRSSTKGKTYLPYSDATVERTIEFLKTTNGILRFPETIQHFVETVHFDDELLEELNEKLAEEKAEEMYRTMAGQVNRIQLNETLFAEELTLSAMATLTDGDAEAYTRLIEDDAQPLILLSSVSVLQRLGALPVDRAKESLNRKELIAATIGVPRSFAKTLIDSGAERLEDSPSWGFFAELPATLYYDNLIGLTSA